jgi:hypothetical protein
MPRTLVLAITMLVAAGRVRAQAGGAPADTTRSRECWRGHPAPTCDNFFLTEFGVVRVLTSSSSHFDIDYGQGGGGIVHYSDLDFGNRLQFTIGPMFNRGPRRAIGGTVSFSTVHNGFRAAAEARHRWWGPGNASLDLSAGALRIDVPSVLAMAARTEYGVTAGIHLVSSDLVHATGRADMTMVHGGPHVAMSVEFGVGSWLTLVVAPIGAVVDAFAHAET